MGSCLLGNCQVVLAKCLADGECLENLICLQLCNGRPDETACQVIRTIKVHHGECEDREGLCHFPLTAAKWPSRSSIVAELKISMPF